MGDEMPKWTLYLPGVLSGVLLGFLVLLIWWLAPTHIDLPTGTIPEVHRILPIENYERYSMARSIIIRFEGFSPVAYCCASGKLTIGYGRTVDVCALDSTNEADEQAWLADEVKKIDKSLDLLIKVPLTEGQRAALISFIYNVGLQNFKKSTLLKKLNAGDTDGAGDQFSRWVYAKGQKLNGLIHRREEEAKLFMLMTEGELK
jgi:lysozyme